MTDQELKEFNDFVGENPIRNKFLPIMEYICKLTKDWGLEEYEDKEGKTSSIRFQIKMEQRLIEGRVCYDWCSDLKPELKDVVIFELWWDEECYCMLHTPIQMMNMVGVLMGKVKIEGIDKYKIIRTSDHLFPVV